MKKFLGVLMACCMLLAMAQPIALAVETVKLVVSSATIEQGSTGTVTIKTEGNPGLAALKFYVKYDDALELQGAQQGDLGEKFLSKSFVTDNGTGNWNILDGTADVTGDGTLVTLTFAPKEGTAAGKYDVTISQVVECYNYDDDDVPYTLTNGVVTVTAPVTNYTVSFDANGGTGTMDPRSVAAGTSVALPTCTFTAPEGKEFDKWTIDGKDAADPVTVNSNITLVANWRDKAPAEKTKYTVSFAANGGTGTMADVEVEDGTEYTIPACTFTAPDGKEFDKWTIDGADAAATITVTGNVKLTANWKDKSSGGGGGTGSETPTPEGCYVATSVYGSYDCPQVWTLRRYRDDVLGSTWYGRLFIKAYYAVSPTAVRLFGNCDWFQDFFRARLDNMVDNLQEQGFESTPYEDLNW